MEEFSIEQKAQRYDKALEKAKNYHSPETECNIRIAMENLFPELAESEDEKIRKRIIQALHGDVLDMEEINKCTAWLEKQGKNKPQGKSALEAIKEEKVDNANKVEPKFHKGDWIIRSAEGFKHNTYLVTEVKDYYVCEDLKGRRVTFTFNDVHKNFKLWDISDARDGDVLATEPIEGYHSPFVAIYKKQNEEDFNSYCFIGFDGKFYKGENGHSTEEVHPATKEQRDSLMKAMTDAGYTFDFEKRELKKIEQKPILDVEIPFGTDSELVEEAITIPDGCYAIIEDNKVILRKGEKKSSWSEEDGAVLDALTRRLEGEDIYVSPHLAVKCLKSLKDRVQPQPKREWSEEDINMIDWLIRCCEKEHEELCNDKYGHQDIVSDLKRDCRKKWNWLESLKNRVAPQKQWKPTAGQMVALDGICSYIRNKADWEISQDTIHELYSMSEQLKKLMEE